MTYEHGKAPADAPVTWDNVVHEGCEIVLDADRILRGLHASDADTICRWAHLAALADEAAPVVEAFGTDAGGFRGYWLRRYDAAKGE